MALRRPDPSLDGIVAGPFCGYEESGREVRRRQTATDRVPVIISFGDPIDLVELSASGSPARRVTSFVAGLHDGYVVTRFAGTQHGVQVDLTPDRKSTRLNSSHVKISYAVFCLKKKRRIACSNTCMEIVLDKY